MIQGWPGRYFFPGQSSEFIGRIGISNAILEGIDLGFRSNGAQSKIDLKTQLYASKDHRWAAAFSTGLGWNQALISSDVSQYTLSTFSRRDLDLSLNLGYRHPDIFEIYGGPRLIVSRVAATISEEDSIDRLPDELMQYHPKTLFQNEQLTYTGATIGTRIGYYFLFFDAECTAMWIDFQPQVFGEARDLSGWHLSPSIAVTFVPGGIASLKQSRQSIEKKHQSAQLLFQKLIDGRSNAMSIILKSKVADCALPIDDHLHWK